MATRVLIIEDDPPQRRILEEMVRRIGCDPVPAESAERGLEIVSREAKGIGLILLDLMMPGMGGFGFLEQVQGQRRHIPVIVQTAQGSLDMVVRAMRAGADDFVVKPVASERLKASVQNLLRVSALTDEVRRLNSRISGSLHFDDLIASSPAMANVLRLGRRAAQSHIPVLIEGASGVGKDMLARAIHGESARAGKPFIAVNCAALPEHLVESILFGHEKGAFTGAETRHAGKFAEADGGTLFLDEVADLPLDLQGKLLRALQDGEIDPIGARRSLKVNVRVISATNRDMIALVKEGRFRDDLYYRLNVFPVMMPPLRARQEDIPALVQHFLQRFAAEEGRKVRAVVPEALDLLTRYSWPGNVRQLENAVFRAIVLADRDVLTPADFPQIAASVPGQKVDMPPLPAAPEPIRLPQGQDAVIGFTSPIMGTTSVVADGMALGISAVTAGGHIRTLEDVEADMIRLALHRYRGQMSEVARKLGIGRSTLYRKMRDLGLDAKM